METKRSLSNPNVNNFSLSQGFNLYHNKEVNSCMVDPDNYYPSLQNNLNMYNSNANCNIESFNTLSGIDKYYYNPLINPLHALEPSTIQSNNILDYPINIKTSVEDYNQSQFNFFNNNNMSKDMLSTFNNTFSGNNDDNFLQIFYPMSISHPNNTTNVKEYPLPTTEDIKYEYDRSNSQKSINSSLFYLDLYLFENTSDQFNQPKISFSSQCRNIATNSLFNRRKGSLSYTPGFDTEKEYEEKKSMLLVTRNVGKYINIDIYFNYFMLM